jgi:hypothetical protein
MKKLLVIAVLVSFTFIGIRTAFAVERTYGAGGCGLGSMLLGNEPGMIQVLVLTLNSLAYNQTFGISSGTLNCEKTPTKFVANPQLNQFVVANLDSLAKDIARGEGESLNTLAELTGLSSDKKVAVFQKLQANFSNIFPSEKVEAPEVIDQIMKILNS